jgi:signal peptidase II
MIARAPAIGFILAIAIAVADQATKIWALDGWFFPPRAIEVTSFLNMVAVWNSGVSFGFLAGHSEIMPYILAALASAVTVGMAVWLTRARTHLLALGLGLVIGGAAGNIIDRLRFQAVVDFIDVHVGGYHWPAFNLADSAITVGVGLLLIDSFVRRDA